MSRLLSYSAKKWRQFQNCGLYLPSGEKCGIFPLLFALLAHYMMNVDKTLPNTLCVIPSVVNLEMFFFNQPTGAMEHIKNA